MMQDTIQIPALSELMARVNPNAIPRWTGNDFEDLWLFAHYELSVLQYRFNRSDLAGMRHSLAEVRKHLDRVESDFLLRVQEWNAQAEE